MKIWGCGIILGVPLTSAAIETRINANEIERELQGVSPKVLSSKNVKLIIAVSASNQKKNAGVIRHACAGRLSNDQREVLAYVENGKDFVKGPGEANVSTIIEAVQVLLRSGFKTKGALLEIVTDQGYLLDYLNEPAERRIERRYKTISGKSYMESAKLWGMLDNLLVRSGLRLLGRNVASNECKTYKELKTQAKSRADSPFDPLDRETV